MIAALPPPTSYCRQCGQPRGDCHGGTGCGFDDDFDWMEWKYGNGIRLSYGRVPPNLTRVGPSFGSGRREPVFASHPIGNPLPELEMKPGPEPQAPPRALPPPPVDFVGAGAMHRRWR
jgi:hypothetical protein